MGRLRLAERARRVGFAIAVLLVGASCGSPASDSRSDEQPATEFSLRPSRTIDDLRAQQLRDLEATEVVVEQAPVSAGSVAARWSKTVPIGDTGIVVVEVRALPELPTRQILQNMTVVEGDSTAGHVVVPVYVVPGRIELRLDARGGIELRDNAAMSIDVQLGAPRTASWGFTTTSIGDAALVLSADQAQIADPDFPLRPDQLDRLSIDDLGLNMVLEVTPVPSDRQQSIADDDSGSSFAVLLAVLGALGVSAGFALWLASDVLTRRGRLPRVARALGYLPRKLAEFKSLKGSSKPPRGE